MAGTLLHLLNVGSHAAHEV